MFIHFSGLPLKSRNPSYAVRAVIRSISIGASRPEADLGGKHFNVTHAGISSFLSPPPNNFISISSRKLIIKLFIFPLPIPN